MEGTSQVLFAASGATGTFQTGYVICDETDRCARGTLEVTVAAPTGLPDCSVMVVDSFQAAPWTFTFQIRNSSNQPVDFDFLIPSASYELNNLVFNGSGQNVTLAQTANGDGTFDITVSGTVPAYQSVGGQQPNGFEGQTDPTQDTPTIACELE